MSSTVKIHEAGCTCLGGPKVGDTMVCDQGDRWTFGDDGQWHADLSRTPFGEMTSVMESTLQNLKWDDEHMAMLSEIPWSF